MKKLVLHLHLVALCSLSLGMAAAQTTTSKFLNDMAIASPGKGINGKQLHSAARNDINIKAVRYFRNFYPAVWNESWYNCDDGFVAKFVANEIETKDYFDKKGNWIHSIQTYGEAKLPIAVRAVVKTSYYDYSITQVEEVRSGRGFETPVYLVHIKLNNRFKIIRVYNEETEEMEFKK